MLNFLPPTVDQILSTAATALAMYGTILLLAKLCGVRSFAELSSFDIAVSIAIGSIMASTVVTGPSALLPGIAGLVSLYGFQVLISGWRRKHGGVQRTIDAAPILLADAGCRIRWENMASARVTEDDLRTALRAANVSDPSEIQAIVMEGTGRLHVLHGHGAIAEDAWMLQGVRR